MNNFISILRDANSPEELEELKVMLFQENVNLKTERADIEDEWARLKTKEEELEKKILNAQKELEDLEKKKDIILKEIEELLSNENYVYLGDTKNAPYGNKDPEDVKQYVMEIVDFFIRAILVGMR